MGWIPHQCTPSMVPRRLPRVSSSHFPSTGCGCCCVAKSFSSQPNYEEYLPDTLRMVWYASRSIFRISHLQPHWRITDGVVTYNIFLPAVGNIYPWTDIQSLILPQGSFWEPSVPGEVGSNAHHLEYWHGPFLGGSSRFKLRVEKYHMT